MELALSQKGACFSLLKNTLTNDSLRLYDNVDRVCKKYSEDICERIQFLIDLLGEEQIFIYSSYPLTETKQKLISSFSVRYHSSFPYRKTAEEVRKIFSSQVDIVIGDRKEDRELSLKLNSLWTGCPYYDFRHLLLGSSYTRAFVSLVGKVYKKAKERDN